MKPAPTSTHITLCRIAALTAALWGAGPVATAAASPDVVGEVTTLIGVGSVKSLSGTELALQRGALVRVGDRLETGAGGHVHIRFIDGGLVSVRPMSRLHIESYRNASLDNAASIKFTLQDGVMRSVTGQWGEAARDRFRLNTPVAAIGVKGTDFIVKADQHSTYATVVSGAIVMASLEGECAVSLGPCSGNRSATLSADMSDKMLELIPRTSSAPRLVPAVDLQARVDQTMIATQSRPAGKSSAAPGATEAEANGDNKSAAGHPKEITIATKAVSETIGKETNANTFVTKLPIEQVAQDELAQNAAKPMRWLHNVLGWNVPAGSISQRFDEAAVEGRKAVSSNFFITLYRDETSPFKPTTSAVSFRLTEASASYAGANGQQQTVQVSNASLNVDFNKSTFNTQLTLTSPTLGQDNFAASGAVTSNGLLNSTTTGQKFYGAISTDSSQAGYGFEKITTNGKVSGLTLWGR